MTWLRNRITLWLRNHRRQHIPLTNAEKQKRWRDRRNVLAKQAEELLRNQRDPSPPGNQASEAEFARREQALQEREKKLREREEAVHKRENAAGLMSKRQFKLLKAAVHPDKAQDPDLKRDYDELFRHISSLEIVLCRTADEEAEPERLADFKKQMDQAIHRRRSHLARQEAEKTKRSAKQRKAQNC